MEDLGYAKGEVQFVVIVDSLVGRRKARLSREL
jgi:hypothetical protein